MKSINLQQYDIQFSQLLVNPLSVTHFIEYLKSQHSEESLLFLLSVNEFKESTDKKTKAVDVYNEFIVPTSKHTINIPNRDRDQIVTAINAEDDTELDNIFDSIYAMVYRELREDCGTRYLRSKEFQKFVNKMGKEFMNEIAIDVSMKPYEDVILRKEDFSQKSVTQKDVDFFTHVLSDSTEWEALNKQGNSFTSKTRYSVSSEYKPRLFKIQGFLECSAYQAMVSGVDPVVLSAINSDIDKRVRYLDSIFDGEYPSILRHAEMDLTIVKVDLYTVQTVLYEPSLGCYMLICKSTDAYEKMYPCTKPAAKLNFLAAFFEISETRCRYVTITWIDMSMGGLGKVYQLIEKMYFKKLLEMRAENTKTGYAAGIKYMKQKDFSPNKFEGNRSMLDTLDEFFKRHPEKDPSKNKFSHQFKPITPLTPKTPM